MASLTLTQLSRLFKSEWFLMLLGFISIAIFSLAIYSFTRSKVLEDKGIVWKNNVIAGTTTKDDLLQALGQPLGIMERGGKTILLYPTSNELRPNEVEIEENKVSKIKEQIIANERGNLKDYIEQFGEPETIIFGPHGNTAPGHFWGNDGLVVYANELDGTILEIWYFSPTNLTSFLEANPSISVEIQPEGEL